MTEDRFFVRGMTGRFRAYFREGRGDYEGLIWLGITDEWLESTDKGKMLGEWPYQAGLYSTEELVQLARWQVEEFQIICDRHPVVHSLDENPDIIGPVADGGLDARRITLKNLEQRLDDINNARERLKDKAELRAEVLGEPLLQHLRERGDFALEEAEKGQEAARIERAAREELLKITKMPSPDEVLEELARATRDRQKRRPTEKQENVFHKGVGGDFWIRFKGRPPIELPYSKGLDCIHRLLEAYNQHGPAHFLLFELERQHPQPEINIEDVAGEKGLVIPGFGDDEPVDDGSVQDSKRTGDEKMDAQAVRAALARIQDIDREIGERRSEIGKARRWAGDPKKAAEVDIDAENRAIRALRGEKKKLQDLLKQDTAIFGRSREFTKSQEKGADGIRRNIQNARRQITKKDPVLGDHFKSIYIDDKVYISYRPKEPIYWDVR